MSTGVLLLRQIQPDEVRCPAGVLSGDADIHCNIEGHLLQGRLEPTSVEGFCCGEYTNCLTWLAAKKVQEKGGDLAKIIAAQQAEASQRRSRKMLREARLRRAQELLVSDTPEGKKFRRRLRVGEFDPSNQRAS